MLKIAHRINTIEALKKVDKKYGVEIDLRNKGDRLILHHDAFAEGEDFAEWLEHYAHAFLVLNVKTEGIEQRILELLRERSIKDYFFLDLSFPMLVKLARSGEKNLAVRFSEYESLETVLSLSGQADWVWVDNFSRLPLNKDNYRVLKESFRLCLVSPELQGRPREDIARFQGLVRGLELDAVCTKYPGLW